MPLLTSDEQIAHQFRDAINRAENGQGSTAEKNREQATDYYLGRITGRTTTEGLSDQLSGDVADMVDAICSEMSISLLCAGAVPGEIEPDGDEDKVGAMVETTVVNKVIFDLNPGYEILSNAGQSAALYKIGIVHVEASEIETERTRFVGPVSGEEKRILEGESGGEIDADGYLNWTETTRQVVLRNVAPENFFREPEHPGWSVESSDFMAERIYYKRGDLVALGYSWDDVKNLTASSVVNSDSVSRRYVAQNERTRNPSEAEQELIETFWGYLRLPMTDHSLKLYKVHLAGGLNNGVILSKEPADFVGFACGTLIPFVGRADGISIHDRIKPVEDGRTFALRQWENNLAYGNNNELVLGPSAEQSDAQERLPGGYIRSGVPGDVQPLPVPDLSVNSATYMEYMAKIRAERGGASLDMQAPDSQLLRGQNQVGAVAANRVLNTAEMRSAWYARNIAETLYKQLFLLVHQCLTRYEVDPIGAWVADQYVMVDTRQFRPRKSIKVRAGMSSGERAQRVAALDTNIQYQLQAAQIAGPGVLSSLAGLHQALMDRDRAAGISSPQRYWLDPQGQQSLEAQQANAETAQAQQQAAQALEQAEKEIEAAKLQLDKYKHDSELQWKYFDTQADNEMKEAQIVADKVTEMEKARMGNDTGREGAREGETVARRGAG